MPSPESSAAIVFDFDALENAIMRVSLVELLRRVADDDRPTIVPPPA